MATLDGKVRTIKQQGDGWMDSFDTYYNVLHSTVLTSIYIILNSYRRCSYENKGHGGTVGQNYYGTIAEFARSLFQIATQRIVGSFVTCRVGNHSTRLRRSLVSITQTDIATLIDGTIETFAT
jgi:hypothetical protein